MGVPHDPPGFGALLKQNVVWLRGHNYRPATIATHEKYARMLLAWAVQGPWGSLCALCSPIV